MKKIFILLLIMLFTFTFTSNLYAFSFSDLGFNLPDMEEDEHHYKDTPALLDSPRTLFELANETYSYSVGLYAETEEDIKDNDVILDLDALTKIGYQLLGLFFVANLFRKYEELGRLTLATVFPVLIFYGLGFVVLQNVNTIFEIAQSLTASMIAGISGDNPEHLFDFQIVLDHYKNIKFGTLGLGFFVKVYYAIIYYVTGWLVFIASLFVNALLLIRQFKILILRLIAPIMLVAFANPKTSNYGFSFVKKVVKVHLKLFYIQAIVTLFIAFMGTQSSFFMLVIMAVGLIVALSQHQKFLSFLK